MNIAFIGCGKISIEHLQGLEELAEKGDSYFTLTAVCDLDVNRAYDFAVEAGKRLGEQPAVYQDYQSMLEEENLDAVSVLVTHDVHHTIAENCFKAGVHVQMQKPLAISPSFGRKMIADAEKYQKVLTVSEPFVLGAENTAMIRAIQDGRIGPIHLLVDYAVTTDIVDRGFFGGTPWRHQKGKAGAGWINDHGVHKTHLFTELNGPIQEVFAYTDIVEKEIGHEQTTIEPTGEDTAVTVFRFKNGGLGHWMCATSGHGERANGAWVYGKRGCLRPGHSISFDEGPALSMEELVEQYSKDITVSPFAHSYIELAEAIIDGKEPISSARKGLEALAVVFAALESATIGQPVQVQDILHGKKHAYEDTVIQEMKALQAD